MAEELNTYLLGLGVKCNYIHSDVDTLDRVQIMDDLRKGIYDVLIGVNLLREGLDLPEVSLVAILDADKEGFLRSHRSLTQTAGRAERNLNGKVIMSADHITESMQKTIDETNYRREKQMAYNAKYNITPRAINKDTVNILKRQNPYAYIEQEMSEAADPVMEYMSKEQLQKVAEKTKKSMQKAAKEMDYMEAARLRDELKKIEEKIAKM